jgi:hypothetical protein
MKCNRLTLGCESPEVSTSCINEIIRQSGFLNPGEISDGYHTFNELYEHRIKLFVALCRLIQHNPAYAGSFPVWRSKKHSDGTGDAEWFIMGINTEFGKQISYHLPMKEWDNTWFADTLLTAPTFDGHSAADVLARLGESNLI